MEIDITRFEKVNIVDCCAIWNILSSKLLLAAAFNANCYFTITKFVEYECLLKKRKESKKEDEELKIKLKKLLDGKKMESFALSISDLQEVELLRNRKRLGLGELSSIAFAKKTYQAFLTDDQKARKLAKEILGKDKIQTTPQLLGWLFCGSLLFESDIYTIINEHKNYGGPLEEYFLKVHQEYLRISLFIKTDENK